MLSAPGHVVVEPAAGQDHTSPRMDTPLHAVLLDDRTRHGPVHFGDEFGHGRVQPQRDVLLFECEPQSRGQ